jgi:hypothetical protein
MNPQLISDYQVVRYEDLVTCPHETMQHVARFIGISFRESMLEPTVLGMPWQGNSTTGQRFEGISTVPLTAWQRQVTPLEIRFVNRLFGHVLRDHEYERLEPEASVYHPCRGEGPKLYLANRLLWRLTLAARWRRAPS